MPQELPTLKSSFKKFLDEQRHAIADSIELLNEDQARFKPCDGANSLIEIVNHLAWVEHYWFGVVFSGEPDPWPDDDPDIDLKVPPEQSVEETVKLYTQACQRSDEVLAKAELDDIVDNERGQFSMRWIVLHMIEETARHAGHADITRQLIDGRQAT